MDQSDFILTKILQQTGSLPYRKYVEYLIREHSAVVLQQRARAGVEMISEVWPSIAPQVQPRMAGFVDHVNEHFGANWYFWKTSNCE